MFENIYVACGVLIVSGPVMETTIAVRSTHRMKMNHCAIWKGNVCQIKASVLLPVAKVLYALIPKNSVMENSTVSMTNIPNTVVSKHSILSFNQNGWFCEICDFFFRYH